MIEKTVKEFIRMCDSFEDGKDSLIHGKSYFAKIRRTTWWVLFIPVFSSEQIIESDL